MVNSKKEALKAVQWIAGEYGYLQDLYSDLQLIEREEVHDFKYYSKARRLFRYIARCESKADRHVKIVIEQAKTHPELVALTQRTEIAEDHLVKAFSLYSGLFRSELKTLLNYLRYKKYLDKQRNKNLQAIRINLKQLVEKMEVQVKTLLTWTEGLQVCLREFENSFTDLEKRDLLKKAGIITAGTVVAPQVVSTVLSTEALAASFKLTIIDKRSAKNVRRPKRKSTKFIILHHTESSDNSALASIYGQGTANYIVLTNGTVYAPIEHTRISKHAGRSMWDGLRELSNYSVGIEIVGYHYREMENLQYLAVKELLRQLKRIYNVKDQNILPHTAVSYETPNKFNRRNYRPRRWCGMLMATPNVRAKLGIGAMPKSDPDLDAGRLVLVSNASEQERFYTILYPAYKGGTAKKPKIPSPKPVSPPTPVIPPIAQKPEAPEDDDNTKIFKEIGVDGNTAWSIAQEEYKSKYTVYFFPSGIIRTGHQLPDKKLKLDLNNLPRGTKILVGYAYGGRILPQRSAYSVCGEKWNYPSTFYRLPNKSVVTGDDLDSDEIPAGSIVLFRM
ncbi:N-acetylmuramoyl-L-alanine amidase [Candidatus Woesearchaeota archaeon]|nr:N-acetylmuramoyl-L-alanine amidase [Candidatus Woesearchaeota archaeon]